MFPPDEHQEIAMLSLKKSPASARILASRRRRRGVAPRLEGLEDRALLASSAFTAPDLGDLISGSQLGQDTANPTIARELGALKSQLNSGPLADLKAGTVQQAGFTSEANAMLASYNQQADSVLLPRYPNVAGIVKARGAGLQADFLARNATTTAVTPPSSTFVPPQISDLLAGARSGHNTADATINRELGALRSQLLTVLNSGASQSAITASATGILTGFDQQINAQLRPRYPNVASIIQLSGAKVQAYLTSLGTQLALGTITQSAALTQAQHRLAALNTGPLRAAGTTNEALVGRSREFSAYLNILAQALGTPATNPLTIGQVNTLTRASGNAYLADMKASLFGHSNLTNALTSAVTTLQSQTSAIVGGTGSGSGTGTAQVQYQAAAATFNRSLLDLQRSIG